MNLIQRIIAKLFSPLLATMREEIRDEVTARLVQTAQGAALAVDLKIRQDIQAELIRVGKAIGEIQSRVSFTTQTPENLTSLGDRLASLERVLAGVTEPKKPGNHIRPAHEFGNKVRL
jgi:hypothetical protein